MKVSDDYYLKESFHTPGHMKQSTPAVSGLLHAFHSEFHFEFHYEFHFGVELQAVSLMRFEPQTLATKN